ncbi:hypothetical protein EJB05_24830, partial [Eragrostis curvula]
MVLLFQYLLVSVISLSSPAACTTHASPASHGVSSPDIADQLALKSLESRITSDPTQALASWGNISIPMCQWRGVACGSKGWRRGRVVGLDLGQLNLVGTITPALGNLTYLRRLNLPRNRFHGTLPQELGNLHDLETLKLSYNSLQGQIPSSLANCSHLVEISLNSNNLQGCIPSEFSMLQNLEILSLDENRLIGNIPASIGSLANLKMLHLSLNNLTGEIPREVGNLASLISLSIGSNQFSGTIPASLGNLSSLTFLSIYSTELEGSIPPLLGLSSLHVLELGLNMLEGTIPSWLGNLSSLVFIDFQGNSLVGQIPESLGRLEQLTDLSLSENHLSGSIPDSIGNLHVLTHLYLSNNELEGSLAPSIFNISSIEFLDVDYNNLTGHLDAASTCRRRRLHLPLAAASLWFSAPSWQNPGEGHLYFAKNIKNQLGFTVNTYAVLVGIESWKDRPVVIKGNIGKWMDDYVAALHDAWVDISGNSLGHAAAQSHNFLDLDPDVASPARKRPVGRDAAKAAKKKAASASSEYTSKMHDLSVQKIELFKETEVERKARLDAMLALEKVKANETREHRQSMLELEKKRLALEEKRLQMKAEKEEKLEDERIMAINLDTCPHLKWAYYQQLQEDVLLKLSRRRGH